MSGTGASNLGYGGSSPLSNINGSLVNVTSSNNPANFSSNQTQQNFGLFGTKSNIDAAAGKAPGICLTGGAKALKRKIKNITKVYKKMKKGSNKMKSLRKKLRSRMASRAIAMKIAGGKKRKTQKRKQHGGYSQYQNNQPFSMGYSTGGVLSSSESALANPVPFKAYNGAIDNFSKYTNAGFSSKGH
jgi:uncharacterized protein Veg